eukprot:7691526-Lingulodinium_polyedra.AAC.1
MGAEGPRALARGHAPMAQWQRAGLRGGRLQRGAGAAALAHGRRAQRRLPPRAGLRDRDRAAAAHLLRLHPRGPRR